VLIYVKAKRAAFAEFHRVLRAGGRLSLFEPINRFSDVDREQVFCGYDVARVADLAAKLHEVFDAIQPRDSDPMLDFDERDLLELAADAGFLPVELTLEAEVAPAEPTPWEQFASAPGNPRIPSLAGAIAEALTNEEAERFVAHLAPLVEAGIGERRIAKAFLRGTKPGG
jgi:arsenite methyltransferase